MWTGFTFVGYFTPIKSLGLEFLQTRMTSWEVFWVFFYGFATYGNAGFMREQVCKYMCPYARFQSAMFDADTLIVTYDAQRGEPRGRHNEAAESPRGTGDCIDCSLCVQVCPTGIDIRQGLQYECIGCGACADVCNTVMDKVGSARGLVRYATQNAIQKGWGPAQIWHRVLRWRVVIYAGILLALVIGLGVSLALRSPFRVDIVRDRTTLSRITEYGTLQNVYRLQIMNAAEHSNNYRVSVRGLHGIELRDKDPIHVEAAQARWVVVHVDVPYGSGETGAHKIWFDIDDPHSGTKVVEASVFLIPR
jgi:cytochrome c oxidase accessory protein FixG